MPLHSRPALAVPVGPALRESGPCRPPRSVLTGPRSPVHWAPALLRAVEAEASKPRGPWLGRGEGSTPGLCGGVPGHPLGALSGVGGQALEGVLWNRACYSAGVGSLGCADGPSRAQAPQHKQARDPESPASAGVGRARGGGGTPGNPSLSGTRGSDRGRRHTADPSPRQALAELPAPRLSEDLGGDSRPEVWVSKPGAGRTKLSLPRKGRAGS